jgi:hypothetical protein
MTTTYFACLLLIALGTVGLSVFLKIRALRTFQDSVSLNLVADRYLPMLRLLSGDDFSFIAGDPKLRKSLRAHRRELFRGYMRCLTRDYARLLGGLRHAMVVSGHDRPDLSRAIARNRLLFAWTVCKIEYRLALHATGAGTIDIGNLVDAVEVLRNQVRALSATSVAA